ncbi:FAD-dependent oxidoreductase [Microbacterium trichothecenolyticum]|uniref:FAD-dependent oxidoreductase n=1 Tax=Microbacterium trichothecenolyticum TaxID=69370 RepID=UPI001C6E4F5C|nr:FAD-dependent oxidoreductase [Microbacterium trichothecenolyticum]MBW9120495.1 FAD-dependent oxidoreductase [Microbacterium trichothecenolyticum]
MPASMNPPVVAASEVGPWTNEADVIVVGGGASGFTAGLVAADAGLRVLLLEKADAIGGTSAKSGAGMWVPANRHMRAAGIADPLDRCLVFQARTSRPHRFAPSSPTLGLEQWEYDLLHTFTHHAGRAFDALEGMGAMQTMWMPAFPDYYPQLVDGHLTTGRVLVPIQPDGAAGQGVELIRQLSTAFDERGGETRVAHRVVSAVVDDDVVVGVIAATPDGDVALRARQGVVFASGGFTHNPELRDNFLPHPVFSGCAVTTNEGDFIPIAESLGAPLRNMNNAWNSMVLLEHAVADDPIMVATFEIVGRSILLVNRAGRRVANEKQIYSESYAVLAEWDGTRAEYPNLPLIAVWDQANADEFGGLMLDGGMMPPAGASEAERAHVISGATLDELAQGIRERFATYADHIGGVSPAADFEERLAETIERFNEFGRAGRDEDFHRGEAPIEQYLQSLQEAAASIGEGAGFMEANSSLQSQSWTVDGQEAPQGLLAERVPGAGVASATFAPLADEGPYYAALLVPGTLDTKGGPKTDVHGRVLDHLSRPIRGLYAVGNCAASPSAHAYWGAGGTLGPMITFAWLAGQHIAASAAADAVAIAAEATR